MSHGVGEALEAAKRFFAAQRPADVLVHAEALGFEKRRHVVRVIFRRGGAPHVVAGIPPHLILGVDRDTLACAKLTESEREPWRYRGVK